MARLFDPDAHLPDRLQRRIDSWQAHPPKSQFQVYGPLNAYLQNHKFTSELFLVKPQALLREEDAGAVDDDEDEGDRSFDSQGVGVTNVRRYPDFAVCQYWGCPGIDNPKWDIIRILVEVASNESDDWLVYRQVTENLDRVGLERWKGKILGIAMVKNRVALFRNDPMGDGFFDVYGWISIFDPRFVSEINRIHDHSVDTDETVWN